MNVAKSIIDLNVGLIKFIIFENSQAEKLSNIVLSEIFPFEISLVQKFFC